MAFDRARFHPVRPMADLMPGDHAEQPGHFARGITLGIGQCGHNHELLHAESADRDADLQLADLKRGMVKGRRG